MSAAVRDKRFIGIDLGTTYSAVAHLDRGGAPQTIPNAEGELTTPSVVLFEPDGSVAVGQRARAGALHNPQGFVDYAKRDMGEQFYSRPINGRTLSPVTISGLMLKKLKQDAEAKLGPIAGAVITVPAYFDESRRQATVAAGRIADLPVLDIINEPTAAALAYVFRDFVLKGGKGGEAFARMLTNAPPHTAVVYDLGGGTFDVTVMRIEGQTLTVLATDGDVRLGGFDWDQRVIDHGADVFMQRFRQDLRQDPLNLQRLTVAAEQAKRALSRHATTQIDVTDGTRSLPVELTRDQFEQMTDDLLYRTECRLDRVIGAAGLDWSRVDTVLTVGGSTRMPQVLRMLKRATGKEPNSSLAPDEVVAHGAAIHAAVRAIQLYQRQRVMKGWSPPAANGSGNSAVAAADPQDELGEADGLPRLKEDETPVGVTPVKPAAQVPMGQLQAAAAADEPVLDASQLQVIEEDPARQFDSKLTGALKAIKTINVNAHSLGVIMKDSFGQKVNSIIIPRNTPLPTSVTRRYGTAVANQTTVSVRVVEGESSDAEACIPIGKCTIDPLPKGLKKGATIYVTFSYDNSGRLHVKAMEATSSSSASTTVYRQESLEPKQVEKARREVAKIRVSQG